MPLAVLVGKTVLTVDDDYRNVFAVAAVLEQEGVEVVSAESGLEALKKLQEVPGIDVVLMDIMMPEMDGYETMRRIRRIDYFRYLPIIALTAKAMKGDREKCLEAGASDYVSKPVVPQRLLAVLRHWVNVVHRRTDRHPERIGGQLTGCRDTIPWVSRTVGAARSSRFQNERQPRGQRPASR